MISRSSEIGGVKALLSASAVRQRSRQMYDLARQDGLAEWRLDLSRMPALADRVAEVIRAQYPTLDVPFHARWRHFVANGRDLWAERSLAVDWASPEERARAAFDLAITSVLLDAGAGAAWRYTDAATGLTSNRSEGLAIASLRLFESGDLSEGEDPLRADALAKLTTETLAGAFQVTEDNPLVGLDGRAALLRRLGRQAEARPDLFALNDAPRPGGLFDAITARAVGGVLPAPVILEVLLEALGPIWEGRLHRDGLDLGDCWAHPSLDHEGPAGGLVPLHKLSQWLSYSLIEPLEEAGVVVEDIDGLTGLAEYRNGGLFTDGGVLVLRDPQDAKRAHPVSEPLVVGWRSMTVALLDEIAPMVRERLGKSEAEFPLARVLEGGTWATGRLLAKEQRAGGGPPLAIVSDGTVF